MTINFQAQTLLVITSLLSREHKVIGLKELENTELEQILKMSQAQLRHDRSVEGVFIGAILPFLAKVGSFIVSKVLQKLVSGVLTGAASAASSQAIDAIANAARGSGVDGNPILPLRDLAMKGIESKRRGKVMGTTTTTTYRETDPSGIDNALSTLQFPIQSIAKAFIDKALYMKYKGRGIKVRKIGQGLYRSPWKRHDAVGGAGLYLKPQGGGYVDGSGVILGPDLFVAKIQVLGDLLGWLL